MVIFGDHDIRGSGDGLRGQGGPWGIDWSLVVEEGRERLAIAGIVEDRDGGQGGQTRRGELLELRGDVGEA